MTEFLVTDEHISAILQGSRIGAYPGYGLSYYYQRPEDVEGDIVHYFNGNEAELGQILVNENYRSLAYRYGDDDDDTPHVFQWKSAMSLRRQFKPVEIIKLCDCYNYQACESPDYWETEAATIVRAIRDRAIRNIPGYDDAPWAL